MEAYCGNYTDWQPKRRWHWLRYLVIVLLVSGTVAATPAVISYYWNGKKGDELKIEEAVRLVRDSQMPEAMRRSAGTEIYLVAKRLIMALKDVERVEGALGRDAKISLEKLDRHIGR